MQHSGADCGTRDGDAPDHRRTFDVFFSYNSRDRADVERIARHLARRDLEVWFDEWALVPGARFSDGIAHGLLHSAACAVFIGPNGRVDDPGARYRRLLPHTGTRPTLCQDFALAISNADFA